MASGLPSSVIFFPGSTANIGPESIQSPGPAIFGLEGEAMGAEQWVRQVDAFSKGGVMPEESTASEFQSNQYIAAHYAIYPWADKTHELIQPGMLVFMSRHIDPKYRLYNMAPPFKLNIMQAEAHMHSRNSTNGDHTRWRQLMDEHGESLLEQYHVATKQGRAPQNADLKDFYTLSQKPDFKHLTQLGILSNWNFAGTVISKGESSGAAMYLDHHSSTDITYVVGLVAGLKARTSNVWGAVVPGDHLCLVLRRADPNGPLQWVPWHNRNREYPPRSLSTYTDKTGRIVNSHILYIGYVTEATERDTTVNECEMAMGLFSNNVKEAYEACGPLSNLTIQIRIGESVRW
jgi:hypothetical protein